MVCLTQSRKRGRETESPEELLAQKEREARLAAQRARHAPKQETETAAAAAAEEKQEDLAIEIFESSSLLLAHTQIEPLDAGLGGVQQPHGEAADLALPLRHRGVHQRRLPGQRDHHAPPHRPLSFSLPRRPRTTSSSAATSSASTPSAEIGRAHV